MIDALLSRIDALNNPTVVGLDPTLEMICGRRNSRSMAKRPRL